MKPFYVKSIGNITIRGEGMFIELDPKYIPALQALDGFSHLNVIWWFDEFDNEEARSIMDTPQPYKNSPPVMGILATRSPIRPNPIALTAVQVIDIDYDGGIIQVAYIDANDGTPVIDIKPYTPSLDRIESPAVPSWCRHWPKSMEESKDFNWEDEFNF